MIEKIARHHGVSFVPGECLVHVWTSGMEPERLREAWSASLVEAGLADPLPVTECEFRPGLLRGSARVYRFLPLPVIRRAAEGAYDGSLSAAELRTLLADFAVDAYYDHRSYGLYPRVADSRRWVSLPTRLGQVASLVLGIGRRARLFTMNAPDSARAPMAFASMDKAFGRDLLQLHGLPVPPGCTVESPEEAAGWAARAGYPVVLKRLKGANSEGVLCGITNRKDCEEGAALFLEHDRTILVERMVQGMELRLHFVRGKLYRMYRAERYVVEGDGKTTLGDLMAAAYPTYSRVMASSEFQRQRLVRLLWARGLREFGDLETHVPPAGERVPVSAAAGARMERAEPEQNLPAEDIAALERFLGEYGAPSAGIDLIVAAPGAPLREGGAVLEINSPCGLAYLESPVEAVEMDLDAAVRGDAGFLANRGRVPVWLTTGDALAPEGNAGESARFAERFPGGSRAVLDPSSEHAWSSVLFNRQADAFLIQVSEAAILEHGMPSHLGPTLLYSGDRAAFRRRYPATCRTVVQAHGRLRTLEQAAAEPPGCEGGT